MRGRKKKLLMYIKLVLHNIEMKSSLTALIYVPINRPLWGHIYIFLGSEIRQKKVSL